jgi:DNA-binding MarR family transcriptional regulator
MNFENLDVEGGWKALSFIYVKVDSALESDLQQYGLSLSQFTVLQHLADHPERHMRMQQLADAVGLSQSAMSRLVERLEHESCGLLERFHCKQDRRGVYTRITDEGLSRLDEARTTYRSALKSALEDVVSVIDVKSLEQVLRTIKGNSLVS